MLVIFAGLPGTGKSTLALKLADQIGTVYLRIVGEKGYRVAYAVAQDNLRLIADAVNALEIRRSAWRSVAQCVGVRSVEIEVVCSDQAEHRRRVETRSAVVPVTWQEVMTRLYEPGTREYIRIDTAGQGIDQSLQPYNRWCRPASALDVGSGSKFTVLSPSGIGEERTFWARATGQECQIPAVPWCRLTGEDGDDRR
jgi:predicted kinase